MRKTATIARWGTFALTALFWAFASMFVVGSAFEDPGGWTGAGLSAAALVPAAALSGYVLLRPEGAQGLMGWATGVVTALMIVQGVGEVVDTNEVGPVAAVAGLTVALPLAFLGLRHAGRAGALLSLTGLVLAVSTVLGRTPRGSASAVAVPLLFFGVLFLIAGTLEGSTVRVGGNGHRPRA